MVSPSPCIFVTGGNAGIGKALCKQLISEHNCFVFLGSRSLERGQVAVSEIKQLLMSNSKFSDSKADDMISLIQCDVADDASVKNAAKELSKKLTDRNQSLFGLVNNAGTGLMHANTTENDVLNVNALGPKRVTESFLPLMSNNGIIVNVGSGAGPKFVEACIQSGNSEMKLLAKQLCNFPSESDSLSKFAFQNEKDIFACVTSPKSSDILAALNGNGMGAYGLSKAVLTAYTMFLSQKNELIKNKHINVSCVTPGFIDTNMTKGWGATKPPEEGTVSIRHCLFYPKGIDNVNLGQGWFYGSDSKRSPLHFMRNPGDPVYDGIVPEF